MNSEKNIFGASYIVLVLMVLIRIIPLIFPDSRTWGFNHLLFLPESYAVVFFILAFAALVFPFMKQSSKWGGVLAQRFSKSFYESRLKYMVRLALIAVMTVLFIIFAAPTHFLGDGYALLHNVASETGSFIKWSERGVTMILLGIQSLVGPKNAENALLAFRIVSVVSGIISIWMFILIAGIMTKSPVRRLLVFAAMFFSAVLLLFFGYVESYPLLWISFTGFIYFSLRYIKEGVGLLWIVIFLLFGIFIHLQMLTMMPAFVFLLLCRGRGLEIYKKHKGIFIAAVIVLAVAGILIFAHKFRTDLYFENMFLPLFSGKPIYPPYALVSLPHMGDVLNEIILLSPLIVVFLILSWTGFKRIKNDRTALFLALVSAGTLLFLFAIDAKLTMPRDWDLFSLSAFGLTLLSIMLIKDKYLPVLKRLMISLLVVLFLFPLPFLMTSLRVSSAMDYAFYMIGLDLPKSFSTIFILNKYLEEHNFNSRANILQKIYNMHPFTKGRADLAMDLIKKGDLEGAWRVTHSSIKDRFDQNYHTVIKELYLREGNHQKALEHANKALQLQAYADYLYAYRGEIYLLMGRHEEAMRDFRRGYELNSGNPTHPEGIASIFFINKQYDSGIVYTEKMLQIDSTKALGYFMLARAHAMEGRIDKAMLFANRYAEFAAEDTTLTTYLNQLLALIKREEAKRKKE